jgi:hypothetical protein
LHHNNNRQVILDDKQITLDQWLIKWFRDKLIKRSTFVGNEQTKNHFPHLLYRNIIEERGYAAEEEIATLTEKYVIIQIFTYGGFLPTFFQQQYVFKIDEFPSWIMKRSCDLFLQCINSLDDDNN